MPYIFRKEMALKAVLFSEAGVVVLAIFFPGKLGIKVNLFMNLPLMTGDGSSVL